MSEEEKTRKRKRRKPFRSIPRKRSSNPFDWLWLLAIMATSTVMNMFVTLFETIGARSRVVLPPAETAPSDEEEHPNIYERGGPCPPRPRTYDQWGYDHRPSLERLMRDLSRPGRLGRMAAGALLARIANHETRVWAANRIEDGDYLELRRAKSASSCEADILACWDRYARADALELVDDEAAIGEPGEVLRPRP